MSELRPVLPEPSTPKKRRWAHEAKGRVLRSHTGVVYVPFEEAGAQSWNCVTLFDPHGVYPPGGYNIVVGNRDIETAESVHVDGVPDVKDLP